MLDVSWSTNIRFASFTETCVKRAQVHAVSLGVFWRLTQNITMNSSHHSSDAAPSPNKHLKQLGTKRTKSPEHLEPKQLHSHHVLPGHT